jgi:hypothetical protein
MKSRRGDMVAVSKNHSVRDGVAKNSGWNSGRHREGKWGFDHH